MKKAWKSLGGSYKSHEIFLAVFLPIFCQCVGLDTKEMWWKWKQFIIIAINCLEPNSTGFPNENFNAFEIWTTWMKRFLDCDLYSNKTGIIFPGVQKSSFAYKMISCKPPLHRNKMVINPTKSNWGQCSWIEKQSCRGKQSGKNSCSMKHKNRTVRHKLYLGDPKASCRNRNEA